MFSHMEGTLIIAGLIAAGVFVAAFAAEGRGQRVIRMLLGEESRRPVKELLFEEIERPTASLDVVDKLGRAETRELQTTRR